MENKKEMLLYNAGGCLMLGEIMQRKAEQQKLEELERIQSNLKIIISSIANNDVANISDFVIADMRLRIKQYTIELKRTNNTRLKLQDVNINIAKELTQIITRLITCQKGNDNAYKYLIHVIDYFTILTHFEV